mmetsp:Transcript_18259/g.33098  ORF Transcript_18259/g.33098 Transcript_18259/m.33098 type:complete len:147 (+) Transcript_18259:279-719(+)
MEPPQDPPEPPREPPKVQSSLVSFLKKKRGRPSTRATLASDAVEYTKKNSKVAKKNNTVAKPKDTRADSQDKALSSKKKKKKQKSTRTNWGSGKHLEAMKKAVEEWQTHTGRYLDGNGEARSLHVFCNIVGIPYDTFKKYVTSSNN